MKQLMILGGGAAGIFAAICAKEHHPELQVTVIEKHNALLSKVRVSGGGRCNVTHACLDPKELVLNYPRGHKELLGPFHQFQPKDTIEWFEKNGVQLKTEKDGRMFPITDSSQTIIDCLLGRAKDLGIEILVQEKIENIEKTCDGFEIFFKNGTQATCAYLLLATGSALEGYRFAESLGHTIANPIPSLFTFNIPTSPLKDLSGVACEEVVVNILGGKRFQKGPLLITHFGFSGPAILKLSAFEARLLHDKNYKATVSINWLPNSTSEKSFLTLQKTKAENPAKLPNLFGLPKNLWKALLEEISEQKPNTIPDKRLRALSQKLHADLYQIDGKTTNKEEFVTCGGITLNEIDFKTMQSKKCPGLYFAGEILDIDGITGGFNFQNAWTTAFIAGKSTCS